MIVRAAILFFFIAACAATPGEDQAGIGKTGGLCGGIGGFPCERDGDYCAMEATACVDVADAAGICKPTPQFCTREFRPVCGCDGVTYANGCSAAAAGVSVASEAACE